MKTSEINLKIDENIVADFEEVCDIIGLSVPTAIQAFIKVTINTKGLPFALQSPYETYRFEDLPEDTQQAVIEGRAILSGEKQAEYRYSSADEMIAALNSAN